MSYSYFNKIRQTRWLSVRNHYNVLLFTQRSAFFPKLCLMEFCVASNPEEVIKNKNFTKLQEDMVIAEDQLKYNILKNFVTGGVVSSSMNPSARENQLRFFLQNAGNYSASDIIKILKIFAKTNNRPGQILKSLCDILLIKNVKYTEWECSDLLFSLSKLSYRNEAIIKSVADQLKKQKNFKSKSAMKSLLHSFAELRYRDCLLLEDILQFFISSQHDIKTVVQTLVSFSYLNFSPPHMNCLIKQLSELDFTDFPQTKDYINFIWACVILNKHSLLPQKHFLQVLSESFIEQLEKGMKGMTPAFKIKLLNINKAASLLPSYKGPVLNDTSQYKVLCPPLPHKSSVLLESLKDSFSYIVAKDCQMEFFVDTGSGFYIDIEIFLDPKDWPFAKKTKKDPCKMGVILLNYSDFCTDKSVTGISAFKINMLKSLGHTILDIPYFEYPLNANLSEKIFYLRDKIKNLKNGNASMKKKSSVKEE